MFKLFLDAAGSLDGVFNNAGSTGPVSKIQDLKPDDLEVLVKTKGGDLEVSFKKNSDTFSDIYLQSEIEKNFEGLLPKI